MIFLEVTTEDAERLVREAIAACGEDEEAVAAYVTERLPEIIREAAA